MDLFIGKEFVYVLNNEGLNILRIKDIHDFKRSLNSRINEKKLSERTY